MTSELPESEWEFIARRKQLQYKYAKPYMTPVAGKESEAELRERVRSALKHLSPSERILLRNDIKKVRIELLGFDYSPFI